MADHSASQPEPVLTRAGVVTAISGLSAALAYVGLPDIADALSSYSAPIAGVILVVGPVVTAWLARRHVTPVASPRTADGSKLVVEAPVTLPVPPIGDSAESYPLGMPTSLPDAAAVTPAAS